MITTGGKGEQGEIEEGMGVGINGDGRRAAWGGKYTIQYTEFVLQNCTPQPYMFYQPMSPPQIQ